MTGYTEPPGITMPLSPLTIGSLADLGYVVNVNVAEAFTLGGVSASVPLRGLQPIAGQLELKDMGLFPTGIVNRDGTVIRLPMRP